MSTMSKMSEFALSIEREGGLDRIHARSAKLRAMRKRLEIGEWNTKRTLHEEGGAAWRISWIKDAKRS